MGMRAKAKHTHTAHPNTERTLYWKRVVTSQLGVVQAGLEEYFNAMTCVGGCMEGVPATTGDSQPFVDLAPLEEMKMPVFLQTGGGRTGQRMQCILGA